MDYRLMDVEAKPTEDVDVRDVFGIDVDMKVKGFYESNDRVPLIDPTYKFDADTTLAILAGFQYNRRVLVQGYHGTGKSTHIEQVAARLNWPCVRVNLDGHISRLDLVGRDAVVVREGKQVMPFADHHNARSDDFTTLTSLATCFHFGYHLEHHRRPDVPWWALPDARRAGVAA